MTLQKTLNANDPDKKMEHMTMLDNNRRLDFFFGAHQDPNKTPIADAYSKVGEPKKLLKYVKNSLEDKKNKKVIAAFKKDKAYYEGVLKKNGKQLNWIGFEGANLDKKKGFDASDTHKERMAISREVSGILRSYSRTLAKQGLSKNEIKDFLLLAYGPTAMAAMDMDKDLKKVDKKYTEETDAYKKALNIHKRQAYLQNEMGKSDARYNRLHQEAQAACKDFLEKKVKKASKKCKESFARFKKNEKESLQPFRKMEKEFNDSFKSFDLAQDGRDHSLVRTVKDFKGNGVVFRGGNHKKLVKKLLEKQCLESLKKKGSEGQNISQ